MTKLCGSLNEKIVKLAPTHRVADVAPGSYEELKRLDSGLVVFAGGSDLTIYGDRAVNWAFRAWHDKLHRELNAPFTLEGETRVALEQARILSGYHGAIVIAEVTEQARYFETHGHFPVDQIAFMKQVLKGKL
jgi:hypothetical protein